MTPKPDNTGLDGIKLVTEPTEKLLNDKQLVIYRDHREKLARWALSLGKNPRKAQGYARETVAQRMYRLDRFYRFVWDEFDGFTLDVSTEHADEWMKALAMRDTTETYNASCQKAVKMLFKWYEFERAQPVEWEPIIRFSSNSSGRNPRHYFTVETLQQLQAASLEMETLPGYTNVTPEERADINRYLAQRLGKPKSRIGPDDWEQVNSWKVPAMIHMTIDAGLRNKEVSQSKVSWIDWDAKALRIPVKDSVKSDDEWVAALRSKTVLILERWVEERDVREKYADTDYLFLTRYGNPYGQQGLNRLLDRLCECAGVDASKATWYSIRRSLATHLQPEGGPKATQLQARHKNPETTMRYDQAPVETRREALERTFG